jgi:hypothetical protein
MRVLTIGPVSIGVSSEQEAEWPRHADDAIRAAREDPSSPSAVWFRTDEGASGVIPVSDDHPVRFEDVDQPSRLLGTLIALGPDADPRHPQR